MRMRMRALREMSNRRPPCLRFVLRATSVGQRGVPLRGESTLARVRRRSRFLGGGQRVGELAAKLRFDGAGLFFCRREL